MTPYLEIGGDYRETVPGIYLIELPLPFSLGLINVYLVRLAAGWMLVDCGMDTPECLEALAREGAGTRTLPRCRALHTVGQLGCFMGRYDDAFGYLTEALRECRLALEAGVERELVADNGRELIGLDVVCAIQRAARGRAKDHRSGAGATTPGRR